MNRQRVVVIGAGIAGLVAAYRLQKRGIKVVVLEAADRVGGRMVTHSLDGHRVDLGAQFLSHRYALLMPLIRELGLENDLIEVSPYAAIVRGGKFYKIHSRRFSSFLQKDLLTPGQWGALLCKAAVLSATHWTKPLNDYAAWHTLDTEDAAAWSRKYYGPSFADSLIAPFIEGFYFQSLEGMSKAFLVAALMFGARGSRTFTLRNGISALPMALASHLDIHLKCPVQKLQIDRDAVYLETAAGAFEADTVVLATPTTMARSLFLNADPLEKQLMDTGYSSTILVTLELVPSWRWPAIMNEVYGVFIPREERIGIAAIGIESRKKRQADHPGERINIMTSYEAAKSLKDVPDANIIERLSTELDKYFPGISAAVRSSHLIRWDEAEPLSPVGRSQALWSYRTRNQTHRKLFLAGDYMGMPFTEGAAETGHWAAAQIK